jgi:hypothetical protein
MSDNKSAKDGFPKNTLSLIVMVLKGFIKNLPRFLITGVLVFAVVYVLFTYLLVYKNQGFIANTNQPFLAFILAVNQKGAREGAGAVAKLRANLFWMLSFGVVIGTVFRIISYGFGEFFKDIVKGIGDFFINLFSKPGSIKLGVFLSGLLASFIFAVIINSQYVSIILALSFFLLASMGNKEFLFMVMNVVWNDLKKLFKFKTEYNGKMVSVFFYAMVLGSGLSIFVIKRFVINGQIVLNRTVHWTGYVIIVLLLGLIILNSLKHKKLAKMMMMFMGLGLIFLAGNAIFAHDGGWSEAGSSFKSWWNSAGRKQAMKLGTSPAFWSGLVSAIGCIMPSALTSPIQGGLSLWDLYNRWTAPPAPVPGVPGPGVTPVPPITPQPQPMYGIPPITPQPQPMYGIPPITPPPFTTPGGSPIQPMYGIRPPGFLPPDFGGPGPVLMYGVPIGPPGIDTLRPPNIQPLYGIRPPGDIGGLQPPPKFDPIPGVGATLQRPPALTLKYGILPPNGPPLIQNPNMVLMYGIPPRPPAFGTINQPQVHLLYGIRPPAGLKPLP